MLDDASNDELLTRWHGGDELAAQILVQRYMTRLTALARSRLSRKLSRRLEAEDVVLSAWRSFFLAARDGRVAVPGNDDIWPLLVTLTLRKLARQAARQTSLRRDVGAEESIDIRQEWGVAIARDPSPAEAAAVADEVETLMGFLDPVDREVLSRRLQGEDQRQIAAELHCSDRSVRRSLQRIRAVVASRGRHQDSIGVLREAMVAAIPASPLHEVDSDSTPTRPTFVYRDILLEELVGQGGFGKVYRARLSSSGDTVAVKHLKKRFWKDSRATESLIRETLTVSALSHPNILRHHGWGLSSHGAPFVVMDWIDGPNAWDWSRNVRQESAEIVECGVSVAGALQAAHAAHVIHGDLTPGNVLRRSDGTFLLSDFGFARSLTDSATAHAIGGTPGFLAPEQISEAFGAVTNQTDIYGLGALLYALAFGRAPMTGRDVPEILANVLSSRPPEPPVELRPDISTDFIALLLQCLSKAPAKRPKSADEVAQKLREIRSGLRVGNRAT